MSDEATTGNQMKLGLYLCILIGFVASIMFITINSIVENYRLREELEQNKPKAQSQSYDDEIVIEEELKAIYTLLAVQSSHVRTIMNMNVTRSHWQTHKGRTAQIECEECLEIYREIREQVKDKDNKPVKDEKTGKIKTRRIKGKLRGPTRNEETGRKYGGPKSFAERAKAAREDRGVNMHDLADRGFPQERTDHRGSYTEQEMKEGKHSGGKKTIADKHLGHREGVQRKYDKKVARTAFGKYKDRDPKFKSKKMEKQIYINKSKKSTKIEKRVSPELAALAGWYLSGDVTRGMGQPTPAQQREFERQIQQAMRKKGRRLRKDHAIEKMQLFFNTKDNTDTYVRKTPVTNAVKADSFLEKVASVPPFAGARFDPTSHRWVKPENYGNAYMARGGKKRLRGSGIGARERSVSGHGKGRIRFEGAGRKFKGS